jgi:hypothetical protein
MSGASKNRKYRAAHEASLRRASEEIRIQKAYISFYHQFNSGSPSIASRGTNNLMQPYQNYGPAGRGKGRGAVGSPLDSFSWITPDAYRTRITSTSGTTRISRYGKNAASYKSIADMLRPKAINAELSNLSGAYSSQSQLIKQGPRKAKSKRNRGSNQKGLGGPSAAQKVMLGNASMSDSAKLIMGISDYNNANSSSKDISFMQFTEKTLIPNSEKDLASTFVVGSATYNMDPDNTKDGKYKDKDGRYKDSYRYTTYQGGSNVINYNRSSEDFDAIEAVRKEFGKSEDPADQIHLAIQEKIYKDGKRNKYLQNFAFGNGTLSMESFAGRDEKVGSTKSKLRASEKDNVQSEADKRAYIQYQLKFEDPSSPDYNPRKGKSLSVDQVKAFNQDQMNIDLTDSDLHSNINTRATNTRSNISKLSDFMRQYEHLKKNKNSSQTHKDKVLALNAEVKLSFPGMDVGGNSAQMIDKLTTRMDKNKTSLTILDKQRDAVSLYRAKTDILKTDIARGERSGLKNRDADKARKAKVRAAEQAAAQKAFDELWLEGAGQALMSDTSTSNLNPERMIQAPSKASELTRVVGIVKKYDAWDQRRNYISGELDTRRSNLNTYYNSNWEQDFTVSDTEASQYMFGSDTPSGTSLTRNAVTAIGINQRKPRKAIENINKILAQTGENRSVYAENLAGIETKLLTLKEKQALKKAENDAIKARIAQQVTDDFNAGNVEINTTFRDSITGTSEELYDLNTQVAEHNTIKTYYDKSLAQTDEDTATLKNTLEQVIQVKKINDFNTITELVEDGGNIKASKPSAVGYDQSKRFKRHTGGRQRMVRSGAGRRTRSGRNLSGLVI